LTNNIRVVSILLIVLRRVATMTNFRAGFTFTAILIFLVVNPEYALAQEPQAVNPLAETWILERVANGEVADLAEAFTEPSARVISVEFLENLATGLLTNIPRQGIRIRNAIIVEPVRFENIDIPYELHLESCEFQAPVYFSKSRAAGDLAFSGSRFLMPADFTRARIDGSFWIDNATFEDLARFYLTEVGTDFYAFSTRFTHPDGPAMFNSLIVGQNVFLNNATFSGAVDFGAAQIDGNLELANSQFTNADQSVSFNSMAIGRHVFLRGAVLAGGVNFGAAVIDGTIDLNEAQFTNRDQITSFNSIAVGGHAFLRDSDFSGGVDFIAAQIDGNLELTGAKFTNPTRIADFNSAHVGRILNLKNAVFEGGADFKLLHAGIQIWADEAQFTNPDQVISFNSATIGGLALFDRATFSGGLDFGAARIASNLQLSGSVFTNPDQTASFNSIAVGGHTILREAAIAGGVSFSSASVSGALELTGARFNNTDPDLIADFSNLEVGGNVNFQDVWIAGPLDLSGSRALDMTVTGTSEAPTLTPSLNFSRANVIRNFELGNMQLNALNASSMRVGGTATIRRLVVKDSLNLEDANFVNLNLEGITLPENPTSLTYDGMEYRKIKTATTSNEETLAYLLNLANQSAYSAQVYGKLEQYFAEQALLDYADQVYITQRQRLRRESDNPFKKGWDLFLEYTVGYGRRPELAFIWSTAFVLIGLITFRKERGMELVEDVGQKRIKLFARTAQRRAPAPTKGDKEYYNPFWYSLDLFLPFVDLKMAEKWTPRAGRKFARHYMRFQTLAGWILIPIAILSITGIVK